MAARGDGQSRYRPRQSACLFLWLILRGQRRRRGRERWVSAGLEGTAGPLLRWERGGATRGRPKSGGARRRVGERPAPPLLPGDSGWFAARGNKSPFSRSVLRVNYITCLSALPFRVTGCISLGLSSLTITRWSWPKYSHSSAVRVCRSSVWRYKRNKSDSLRSYVQMNFAVHPSAKQPGVPGPWEGGAGHPVLSPWALCVGGWAAGKGVWGNENAASAFFLCFTTDIVSLWVRGGSKVYSLWSWLHIRSCLAEGSFLSSLVSIP